MKTEDISENSDDNFFMDEEDDEVSDMNEVQYA